MPAWAPDIGWDGVSHHGDRLSIVFLKRFDALNYFFGGGKIHAQEQRGFARHNREGGDSQSWC